jgi:hypothetical protein
VLHRSLAIALFAAAFFSLQQSSAAQTTGRNGSTAGYWSQGKWIGYTPAHLKYTRPGAASQAPPLAASSQSKPAINAPPAVQTGAKAAGLAAQSKPATSGGSSRAAKPEAQVISYEEAAPLIVDEGPMGPMDPMLSMPGPSPGGYVEGPGWQGGPGCSMDDPCSPFACGTYCPSWRLYGRAEYLGWWTETMRVPPLVTSSPVGTPQDQAGVLGQAGTRILFGNEGLTSDGRSGGRFTLGVALDTCQSAGVEVTYMTLGSESDSFSASQLDFPILARPFFDIVAGVQDARLIAYPGVLDGSVSVDATTKLQGTEVLFRRPAARSCFTKVDYLIGYRWLQLEDNLRIDESQLVLAGAAQGTTIDLFDQFHTTNNFHGVELGVDATRQLFPLWSLQLIGKVALGNSRSVVNISGSTTTTTVGGTSTHAGGLLAQPTNIGTYERNNLATTTEIGAILHRQLTCNLEATFGYTFLYWSNVARAGEQIDFDVNLSQVPPGPLVGAARPEFSFNSTDFWAQGLHFGLDYTF